MSCVEPEQVQPPPIPRVAEARLIDVVFPEQTNHYGTLFGGQALAFMDKAAFITATGRTSLTVEVEMFAEDLLTGVRALAAHGRFVLVALDTTGRPTPVPALRPSPSS